jgi:hypothetical protein
MEEKQYNHSPPPSLDGLANKGPSRTVENWVEAKNIYNSYLHDILVPVVYDTMYSVYRDAENLTESKLPEDIERTFMDFLGEFFFAHLWFSDEKCSGNQGVVVAHH